jgi:hypothetical protein
MNKSNIIAPAILSLLTIVIASKANAVPEINPIPEGFEVTTGNCYVHFNHSGNMIYIAEKCNDRQVNEAKKAAQSYVREQGGSGSEHMNGGSRGDSGASGPDFFEVTGVANNDLGALHQPALGSKFIARQIRNGTVLRNLGCSKHGGEIWCQVELRDNPTWKGWVRQIWLREH